MRALRLDLALVQAGLATSRTQARRIIEEGRARVAGRPAARPAQPVQDLADLSVADVPDGREYASRAAHKLAGALDAFGIDPAGARCIDVGASSGGFTDVLLRRGAMRVAAVDIGAGQLAAHLAADPRVAVHDSTSIRGLLPADVGGPADLLVADLSFISLRTVMADLTALVSAHGRMILMVKPQFEVGRTRLPRGGVVRCAQDRREAVHAVAREAAGHALAVQGAVASPLPGQDGNREVFLALRRVGECHPLSAEACDMIDQAIHEDASRPAPTGRRAGRAQEDSSA